MMEDQVIGRLVDVHRLAAEGLVEDVQQLRCDRQPLRIGPGVEPGGQQLQTLSLLPDQDGSGSSRRPAGQPVEGRSVPRVMGQDQRGLDQHRQHHQRPGQPTPASGQASCPGHHTHRSQHVQRQDGRKDVARHLLGSQAHLHQEEDGVGRQEQQVDAGWGDPALAQQANRAQEDGDGQEGQLHLAGTKQQRYGVEERAGVLEEDLTHEEGRGVVGGGSVSRHARQHRLQPPARLHPHHRPSSRDHHRCHQHPQQQVAPRSQQPADA